MEEQEQKIECAIRIRPESVMTGFCYAFTYALLQKLKKLKEENLIFESKSSSDFSYQVIAIIRQLQQQTFLNLNIVQDWFSTRDFTQKNMEKALNEIIGLVEEFLAIFHVEQEAEPENLSLKKATRELEIKLIKKALTKTGGNRTQAAKLLEISHRRLLYQIKDYDLEV